jgi:hypothetical protein
MHGRSLQKLSENDTQSIKNFPRLEDGGNFYSRQLRQIHLPLTSASRMAMTGSPQLLQMLFAIAEFFSEN